MRHRRVAVWVLSVPLMVVGSQLAHALAYRWVYPQTHLRLTELLASGHGYMGAPAYAPLLLALVFAAELVGGGWALAAGVRRGRLSPVPPWAFALLPMIAFALQELLERWLSGASAPWLVVFAPTFRAGLLLQLPFALLAYLAARILLRAAARAGSLLRGMSSRPILRRGQVHRVGPVTGHGDRRRPVRRHSGRGPPRDRPAAHRPRRSPRTARSPAAAQVTLGWPVSIPA